jgi:hypothetical protein
MKASMATTTTTQEQVALLRDAAVQAVHNEELRR